MGRKKENKKRKEKLQKILLESNLQEINSTSSFLLVISSLQEFCDDNILALKPLLDEDEDNEQIKQRIIHFCTISDILDSLEQLISIEEIAEEINKEEQSCDEE